MFSPKNAAVSRGGSTGRVQGVRNPPPPRSRSRARDEHPPPLKKILDPPLVSVSKIKYCTIYGV